MSTTIPKTQIAAWLEKPQPGARLQIRNDIEVPSPKEGEVLVKLEYSGFCHSDVHSIYGETPMSTDIAGHEGVGYVIQLGPNVPEEMMNSRVGIKSVHLTLFGNLNATGLSLTRGPRPWKDGSTAHATPARYVPIIPRHVQTRSTLGGEEYIVTPVKHATRIPAGLKSEIAAPLLCAGLTMYSALAKARLRPGDWVVFPGAGGGLGHLGVQIAAKRGYKVIAIDTGDSKKEMCMKLGASVFLDFKTDSVEGEVKRLTNGFGAHAVIVTVGSDAAYDQALKLLRNLGTLVCIGLPRSGLGLPISPFMMVVRSLTIVGSSVGTAQEMDELLEMAVKGEVKPEIAVFEFDEINDIMEKLARFEIGGRVVLRLPE
ncbi:alcohol dehydrogenase [Cladophialophora psammophila CBS 110553]|uniref:Alcohol dehydrogenase n=1 Tax=Cladophialophora psammophila CBS 110553 TaxID=1182543 RepID=W9X212_9EURO|nr:alcohol dehydrogenase [Cladophialophora psammophila CBS 110553]EXJ74238.1 alcohol dehydrogenase [Cladophialophora psammophila CBS 110553]